MCISPIPEWVWHTRTETGMLSFWWNFHYWILCTMFAPCVSCDLVQRSVLPISFRVTSLGQVHDGPSACSTTPTDMGKRCIRILQGYFTGTIMHKNTPVPLAQRLRIWVNESPILTNNWCITRKQSKQTLCSHISWDTLYQCLGTKLP